MEEYGYDPRDMMGLYTYQKQQRKRDFYTSVRTGLKQQQQEKKKFQAEKTRELLRCVYPANPSGSKVISLGLDPTLDFQPVVNLYKAGFPGVKFESYAFDELCNNADFIRNYLQGAAANDSGQLQIADTIIMKFTTCFGKPAVDFISAIGTEKQQNVLITVETWMHIYDMLPLLRRVFHSLANAAAHVGKLYADILSYTQTNNRLQHPQTPIIQDVKNFLYALNPDTMTKEVAADSDLDKYRAYYELLHFCLYDIAKGVRLT